MGKDRIQSLRVIARGRNSERRVETCKRRTRRSASTIGGAAPDTTIGLLWRIARERVLERVPTIARYR